MYLGLDLGTSGIKAMLVDENFATIGVAHAPLTVSRPHPGWSEQAPADWIAASEAVIGELAGKHPQAMARLAAIGLSGHMHGATLLDASPLGPAMRRTDGAGRFPRHQRQSGHGGLYRAQAFMGGRKRARDIRGDG
jgi:xylulokinase